MDRLEVVLEELRRFVAEREWDQFHDPKNLAMALGSEAGELMAEYRWLSNTEADVFSKIDENQRRIAAEAADVGLLLFLFSERIGVDLVEAMMQKIAANRRNYPVEQSRGKSERPT